MSATFALVGAIVVFAVVACLLRAPSRRTSRNGPRPANEDATGPATERGRPQWLGRGHRRHHRVRPAEEDVEHMSADNSGQAPLEADQSASDPVPGEEHWRPADEDYPEQPTERGAGQWLNPDPAYGMGASVPMPAKEDLEHWRPADEDYPEAATERGRGQWLNPNPAYGGDRVYPEPAKEAVEQMSPGPAPGPAPAADGTFSDEHAPAAFNGMLI